MGRKRRAAEEIIGHLREVEIRLAKGETKLRILHSPRRRIPAR